MRQREPTLKRQLVPIAEAELVAPPQHRQEHEVRQALVGLGLPTLGGHFWTYSLENLRV